MHTIHIPYFPKALKYVTPILGAVAIYLVRIEHPIWGVVLLALALVVLTTEYTTQVDDKKKEILDSISILWIPLNTEVKKFNRLTKIVVTKGNYAQTVNTRAQSRQLYCSYYTGTLILDYDDSIDLITDTDKGRLIERLRVIATELGVTIEDRPSK